MLGVDAKTLTPSSSFQVAIFKTAGKISWGEPLLTAKYPNPLA